MCASGCARREQSRNDRAFHVVRALRIRHRNGHQAERPPSVTSPTQDSLRARRSARIAWHSVSPWPSRPEALRVWRRAQYSATARPSPHEASYRRAEHLCETRKGANRGIGLTGFELLQMPRMQPCTVCELLDRKFAFLAELPQVGGELVPNFALRGVHGGYGRSSDSNRATPYMPVAYVYGSILYKTAGCVRRRASSRSRAASGRADRRPEARRRESQSESRSERAEPIRAASDARLGARFEPR